MLPKAEQRRISALGLAAKSKAAMERAEAYRVHLEWAPNHPGSFGWPIAFRGAAEKLNERQLPSPTGGRWCSMNVCAMACRLGLRERPSRLAREVLQGRVRAVWKKHPDLTGSQLIRNLRSEHPMGTTQAWDLLTECRQAALKHSTAHKQVGWRLDPKTATR
jgi:hypothetical protein